MGHARRQFGAIDKLPSGRWRGRYRDPSGRRHSRAFAAKSDANAWLAAVETDVLRGEWINPRGGDVLFGTWTAEWLSTRVGVRASTLARDQSYLRSLILPEFEEESLASIEYLHIRKWVADLDTAGYAPGTVHKAVQIVGNILRTAQDAGLIRHNATDRVSAPAN